MLKSRFRINPLYGKPHYYLDDGRWVRVFRRTLISPCFTNYPSIKSPEFDLLCTVYNSIYGVK